MTKKKKIIVMSSLVLLLALTAVLNVLLVQENTTSTASAVTTSNYFTTYRAERTSTRSEELLQIDSVIALYEEDSTKYQEAVELKLQIISVMENELIIENMIKALGFSDAVVSISMESDNINVFINSDELDYTSALYIYNTIKNEAGISSGNIIIMPVYSEI